MSQETEAVEIVTAIRELDAKIRRPKGASRQ